MWLVQVLRSVGVLSKTHSEKIDVGVSYPYGSVLEPFEYNMTQT